MENTPPTLTIGMPVYNGQNFIAEAIESILEQTYTDFELIISDNASNDDTQHICELYARRDSRIVYYRNESNLGAAANFNRLIALASGKYFKWAAHDDICAPSFLEKCVDVLARDTSVVLSYPKTSIIDERGAPYLNYLVKLNGESHQPHVRFGEIIRKEHWCYSIFGIFRTDILKKTPIIDGYSDADRVLLAEISLLGRLYEVPDYLFLRREHALTSTNIIKDDQKRLVWFDPKQGKKQHYLFLKLRGYLAAIRRAPLTRFEKLRCYGQVAQLIFEKFGLRLLRAMGFKRDRSHIATPVDGIEWK